MKQLLSIFALTLAAISFLSCGGKSGGQKGIMCYSATAKEVKVFNTPWGDKVAKIESPVDETGGGRKTATLSFGGGAVQGVDYSYNADGSWKAANISVYVDDTKEAKISVIYDYSKAAVESVKVEGKETPRCK